MQQFNGKWVLDLSYGGRWSPDRGEFVLDEPVHEVVEFDVRDDVIHYSVVYGPNGEITIGHESKMDDDNWSLYSVTAVEDAPVEQLVYLTSTLKERGFDIAPSKRVLSVGDTIGKVRVVHCVPGRQVRISEHVDGSAMQGAVIRQMEESGDAFKAFVVDDTGIPIERRRLIRL